MDSIECLKYIADSLPSSETCELLIIYPDIDRPFNLLMAIIIMSKDKRQLQAHRVLTNNQPIADQRMSGIYGMLNHQQETIASLLNKYRDEEPIDFNIKQKLIKQRSQTIDSNSMPNNDNIKKIDYRQRKKKSLSSRQYDSHKYSRGENIRSSAGTEQQHIALRLLNKKSSRMHKERPDFSVRLSKSREKTKLREELFKIYGDDGQKSRVQPLPVKVSLRKKKKLNPLVHASRTISITSRKSTITPRKQTISSRPGINSQLEMLREEELSPLSEDKEAEIQSNDSSDHQQIGAMYYQRQFRDKMKSQCMEQINYLYFSKNEAMKDWIEKLLSLFEKHDKEITAMRLKDKYLYTFDDKFWKIGVFENNDF